MIKVCPECSGVDLDGLKKAFPNETILVGCVGICKNMKGVVYGKVNGQLVKTTSNHEFYDEVKKLIESKTTV